MTFAVARAYREESADPSPLLTGKAAASQDPRQFDLAVRLATAILRPLDHVDDACWEVPALDHAAFRAIAEHPAFRGPANRLVGASVGITSTKIDGGLLSRLRSSAYSRLAALIATGPIGEVSLVASSLAAATLWRRISRLVLKADRELARDVLGPENFQIATHEAPMLHPVLADLDRATGAETIFRNDVDVTQCRGRLRVFGLHVLGRFLDASEPALSELFSCRLPANMGYADRREWVGTLNDIHCEQVVKLIRRRKAAWSPIIG